MLKSRLSKIALALLVAAVLVIGVFGFINTPQQAEAASYPISVSNSGITASGVLGSDSYLWSPPDNTWTDAEVWYDIDQGTTNTVTLRLDVSPDGSMWKTTYATVVSNNAADATGYITPTINGRFFRVYATVANTNTVTPTVKVILR